MRIAQQNKSQTYFGSSFKRKTNRYTETTIKFVISMLTTTRWNTNETLWKIDSLEYRGTFHTVLLQSLS